MTPGFRRLAVVAVSVLVASSAGIAILTAQRPTSAVVRVRTLPHLSYAPLYLARAEGYFEQEHLQVEFVDLDTTVADVPLLMRGDLDVLPTVIAPAFLNAVARGGRMRIVAGQHQLGPTDCAYIGVVARPALAAGGALDAPASLKGRRIAISRAFVTMFLLDRLLAAAGVTRADLEEVDVADAIRGESLAASRIDLAVLSEPWLTRARLTGQGVLWKAFDEAAPGLPYTAIIFGSTLLDERPDVGQRFMSAYLRAVRRINQGKTARNVEVLAAATRLEPSLLEEACWPSARADGFVDQGSLQAFQTWAFEQRLVDRVLPPSQLVDDRFAKHATRVLSEDPQR
jgi:NitT/TauT family transport system substrate-binding protein